MFTVKSNGSPQTVQYFGIQIRNTPSSQDISQMRVDSGDGINNSPIDNDSMATARVLPFSGETPIQDEIPANLPKRNINIVIQRSLQVSLIYLYSISYIPFGHYQKYL